jgi:hypothetical protein
MDRERIIRHHADPPGRWYRPNLESGIPGVDVAVAGDIGWRGADRLAGRSISEVTRKACPRRRR